MGRLRNVFSLKKYIFLLRQLIRRDFKMRYRGSLLGVIWSVLNPLLNMLVLTVVFSQVFRQVENYMLYVLSGITVFSAFSDATQTALTSVIINMQLITKVYMPKIIFPLSKVLSASINLLITTVVFIILAAVNGVYPTTLYLLIPFVWVCVILFSAGVGFIVSALHVYFRDTQHLYGIICTIWMYATPILYPLDTTIPAALQPYFRQNPLYLFINLFREITLNAAIPSAMEFFKCAAWAVGLFLIGTFIFVRMQDDFIYHA